jgi:site-specific DNA recombinase
VSGSAAIYVRISKDREGTELGVERQEKLCRQLASRNNYEVSAVFVENDTSASTKSTKARPQYTEMMRRAREGEFSAVIAYSYSRLTRRPQEFNDIISVAEERGVRIITVASGEFDLNLASGRGVARTIAAWDAVEAEQASERIKAAKAQRAERGEWHGGTPPFGYTSANTKLIENPSESALVREAANRVLEGDSMSSIVADWNSKKITTRFGKHWRQTNLRAILTNRAMLGETKAGVKGWEAILDQRTFDRLGRLFSDPSRKATHSPGVKGGKYTMGGGVTLCAACGNKLITGGKRAEPWNKDSPIRQILKCTSVVNGPTACNSVVVDHDRLEAFVFETLIVSFAENERWHQRLGEKDPQVDAKIDSLEAQLTDLRDQQSRINELYIAGDIDRLQHSAQVQRVKDEMSAAQRQRDDLLGKPLLSKALESGLENWRDWMPMKRRSFLKQVIDHVEVSRWPEGTARTLGRRRGESDESWKERREVHLLEVMKTRAKIVF